MTYALNFSIRIILMCFIIIFWNYISITKPVDQIDKWKTKNDPLKHQKQKFYYDNLKKKILTSNFSLTMDGEYKHE